jgi:hypothetical protein
MELEIEETALNDIMKENISEAIEVCKAARSTDIRIRVNGEYRYYEADWLKYLTITTKGEG